MRLLPYIGLLLLWPATASATGFTDHGQDLDGRPENIFAIDGYLRLRGALLNNLDLDRGPTPSGQLLYPVPVDDPTGQLLERADMRLRTDLAAYWPDGGVAVKVRIDTLDNMGLGSAPVGIPASSSTQDTTGDVIRIKRAYGEALTPLGLLAAGRMGAHWGLGMLANGGDCPDCDSGDSSDRIAFITTLAGHIWAFAYDFTSQGPFVPDRTGTRVIDIAPSASVHSLTFAVLNWRDDLARKRRRLADKVTAEYGGTFSYRWQNKDVPASYLQTAQPVNIDPEQVMVRGYSATATDLWLRLSGPGFLIEAEGAWLHASVDQPSLVPGALLSGPVVGNQFGVALESRFGNPEDIVNGGLNAGFASGDQAPGFGAFPAPNAAAPRAGDLDGPQANPPYDMAVNNFRFNPDYHIDRILFREIIGTVTDAFYLRPHVLFRLFQHERGQLEARLAAVASFAVYPESTPGGSRPLGIEIDPTIAYDTNFGFSAALEQGTLIPLAGLDNPDLGLNATVAQSWQLRLMYSF